MAEAGGFEPPQPVRIVRLSRPLHYHSATLPIIFIQGTGLNHSPNSLQKWRKGWDSNPRSPGGLGGFQDRSNKPDSATFPLVVDSGIEPETYRI